MRNRESDDVKMRNSAGHEERRDNESDYELETIRMKEGRDPRRENWRGWGNCERKGIYESARMNYGIT